MEPEPPRGCARCALTTEFGTSVWGGRQGASCRRGSRPLPRRNGKEPRTKGIELRGGQARTWVIAISPSARGVHLCLRLSKRPQRRAGHAGPVARVTTKPSARLRVMLPSPRRSCDDTDSSRFAMAVVFRGGPANAAATTETRRATTQRAFRQRKQPKVEARPTAHLVETAGAAWGQVRRMV